VADLATRDAADGLGLPIAAGAATLSALPQGPLFSVAPYRGRAGDVADALGGLPAGGVAAVPSGRLIWAGLDLWLLEGADPGARLAGLAAVTDQSDAWCALALVGEVSRDALARLVPLDLDPDVFADGASARTLLRHVPLLILRAGPGFELRVPRSYAATTVAERAEAMRAVAARAALP
jgi:sarcosine oxidase subunit gamma